VRPLAASEDQQAGRSGSSPSSLPVRTGGASPSHLQSKPTTQTIPALLFSDLPRPLLGLLRCRSTAAAHPLLPCSMYWQQGVLEASDRRWRRSATTASGRSVGTVESRLEKEDLPWLSSLVKAGVAGWEREVSGRVRETRLWESWSGSREFCWWLGEGEGEGDRLLLWWAPFVEGWRRWGKEDKGRSWRQLLAFGFKGRRRWWNRLRKKKIKREGFGAVFG